MYNKKKLLSLIYVKAHYRKADSPLLQMSIFFIASYSYEIKGNKELRVLKHRFPFREVMGLHHGTY